MSSHQRILQAIDCDSIGTSNDHEVWVLSCINCSTNLLHHLVHWNDLFTLHMPALLRPYLVLDMQPGNTRVFVFTNCPSHIDWIAIASVRVRNQWYVACNSCKRGSPAYHLAHRQ